jgi:hypothetical protein
MLSKVTDTVRILNRPIQRYGKCKNKLNIVQNILRVWVIAVKLSLKNF